MLDSHLRRICSVVGLGLAALAATLIAADPALAADPAPPYKVREIGPATDPSNPYGFTRVGATIFFAADDGVHGIELWKTDGTVTGTLLVKDINPGAASSAPAHLAALNGSLIFAASHPDSGFELWKSDGTLTGTILISDIIPGSSGFVTDGPVVAGGLGYFKVGTAALRPDGGGPSYDVIYVTDGSPAGTRALTPTLNTSASDLTAANGLLYFSADDGTHGYELWRSNGLITGTYLISDVNSGPADANPTEIVGAGGLVLFVANDSVNGPEIWKTTGTPTGTVRVSAFVSDTAPAHLTALGTDVYFVGNTAAECAEVWKTNGTPAGTVLAGSVFAGPGCANPRSLVAVQDTLFFIANDGAHGEEVWRTKGTQVSTQLVADVWPGANSSSPRELTAAGAKLIWTAEEPDHGNELWKVNTVGVAVPALITDILPGPPGSGPSNLAWLNGALYFSGCDALLKCEPWLSDGSVGNGALIADVTDPGPAKAALARLSVGAAGRVPRLARGVPLAGTSP